MEGRFPNVRLPWPMTWFEWVDLNGHQFGALFKEIQYETLESPKEIISGFATKVVRDLRGKSESLGQEVELDWQPDELQNAKVVSTLVYGSCYIKLEGKVIAPHITAYCHDVEGGMEPSWHFNLDTIRHFSDLTWLGPIWLAISFMHCKNTLVGDKEPTPEKIQRARFKRNQSTIFSIQNS